MLPSSKQARPATRLTCRPWWRGGSQCPSQPESTARALKALGFEPRAPSAASCATGEASSAATTRRTRRLTLLTEMASEIGRTSFNIEAAQA